MSAKQQGIIQLDETCFHWLSTQYSPGHAYAIKFEEGWQSGTSKLRERLVRPVCSVILV